MSNTPDTDHERARGTSLGAFSAYPDTGDPLLDTVRLSERLAFDRGRDEARTEVARLTEDADEWRRVSVAMERARDAAWAEVARLREALGSAVYCANNIPGDNEDEQWEGRRCQIEYCEAVMAETTPQPSPSEPREGERRPMKLNDFHKANIARHHEAFAPPHPTMALVACVAEEVGELAGAVLGVTGEKARKAHKTRDDVLDAVADAMTYLSLVAGNMGCDDLEGLLADTFNMVSKRVGSSIFVEREPATVTLPALPLNTEDERLVDEAVRKAGKRRDASADDIRAQGWAVAVHNDYRLNGQPHTFWLFTKGTTAIKGEGASDAEALGKVRAAVAFAESASHPPPEDERPAAPPESPQTEAQARERRKAAARDAEGGTTRGSQDFRQGFVYGAEYEDALTAEANWGMRCAEHSRANKAEAEASRLRDAARKVLDAFGPDGCMADAAYACDDLRAAITHQPSPSEPRDPSMPAAPLEATTPAPSEPTAMSPEIGKAIDALNRLVAIMCECGCREDEDPGLWIRKVAAAPSRPHPGSGNGT